MQKSNRREITVFPYRFLVWCLSSNLLSQTYIHRHPSEIHLTAL
jgi:hypothetical protein